MSNFVEFFLAALEQFTREWFSRELCQNGRTVAEPDLETFFWSLTLADPEVFDPVIGRCDLKSKLVTLPGVPKLRLIYSK